MIDGGPLRTSRPAGRQTANRSESVRYQPEEQQYAEQMLPPEQPRQAPQHRQAEPEPQRTPRAPRSFGWVKWVVIAFAVIGIAVAGWLFWPKGGEVASTIDDTKYQAVFLSNGQVYFGKLSVVNNEFMKLTNVFYLERQLTTPSGEQEGDTDTPPVADGDNSFQLLKYSDVLYGSEDSMIISKDDVIRFENLRNDGVVAKAIANRR